MIKVGVRYPRETVAFVRRQAKQRGISESQVWREIVALGMYRQDMNNGALDTLLNFTIQNLCLSRRVAVHIDRTLLDQAMEDTRRAIESLQGS